MLDAVSTSPGANRVHAYTDISSLERERAGKRLNSCLSAVIRDHVGLGLASPGKVNDDTVSGRLQKWEGYARCQKRAQQVVVDLRARPARASASI